MKIEFFGFIFNYFSECTKIDFEQKSLKMLKKIPTSSKAVQTSDFCFENSRKHLPIGTTEKNHFRGGTKSIGGTPHSNNCIYILTLYWLFLVSNYEIFLRFTIVQTLPKFIF